VTSPLGLFLRALAPAWSSGLALIGTVLVWDHVAEPSVVNVRGLLLAVLCAHALGIAAVTLRVGTRGTLECVAAHAVSVPAAGRALHRAAALATLAGPMLATAFGSTEVIGTGALVLLAWCASPLAVLGVSLAIETALRGDRPPAELRTSGRTWLVPGVLAVMVALVAAEQAEEGATLPSGLGIAAAIVAWVAFAFLRRRVRSRGLGAFPGP